MPSVIDSTGHSHHRRQLEHQHCTTTLSLSTYPSLSSVHSHPTALTTTSCSLSDKTLLGKQHHCRPQTRTNSPTPGHLYLRTSAHHPSPTTLPLPGPNGGPGARESTSRQRGVKQRTPPSVPSKPLWTSHDSQVGFAQGHRNHRKQQRHAQQH